MRSISQTHDYDHIGAWFKALARLGIRFMLVISTLLRSPKLISIGRKAYDSVYTPGGIRHRLMDVWPVAS